MNDQDLRNCGSESGSAAGLARVALDQLVERKYQEWKNLARKIRWRDPQGSLTATALLDEAYLRLSTKPADVDGKNDREVLAIIANVMWQILVDQARSKRSLKRGGGNQIVRAAEGHAPLSHVDALSREDVLTLKFAREQLRRENPRAAEVFDFRFSVGMTADEAAQALNLSRTTIERESRAARAFLIDKLRPPKQ